MTWTYDPTDISTDLAKVRLIVGDTDHDDPLLTDEELTYFIDNFGSLQQAAAQAAHALSGQYSRLADKAVGDLRISLSQKAKAFKDLFDSITSSAAARLAIPIAGGISISEKDAVKDDTDRVVPHFERDQFVNTRS